VQLTKLGLCEPTCPEEEQPQQQQHTKTLDTSQAATNVQTKKTTASLKKITPKQTERQLVEKFLKTSRQHDIIALIEKLLGTISSIANEQDVAIDLTGLLDSPTRADPLVRADPSDTATAVQALCELDNAPRTPAPQSPNQIDNDGDVSLAAQILFSASQSKRKKHNANNVLRTVTLFQSSES
jgi:hypothetical protein